jgi:hypothetical protein
MYAFAGLRRKRPRYFPILPARIPEEKNRAGNIRAGSIDPIAPRLLAVKIPAGNIHPRNNHPASNMYPLVTV